VRNRESHTIAQTRFESVSKQSNDSLLARESSDNEESLGEDASKKGRRIDDIDANEDITLLVEGKEKREGEELIQESLKKQKVDDDKETANLKNLMERIPNEEKVAINVIPLAVKSPGVVDLKIYKEGKKSYYQIIRADGKLKMYMFFSQMLESFYVEDLEDLYYLLKAKYGSTKVMEDLDLLLWGNLNTLFEPHVEDVVSRKQQGYKVLEWKLCDFCGVHSLRMQLCRISSLGEDCWIKSLLDTVRITVAYVLVNTSQLELVLLVYFNEKYAK
nr:hypothetical protein [Tanacetum cinerariifolium]